MADSVEPWNETDCAKYLRKPTATDNKYRRGVLGCFAGSKEFPGAALLTTAAAIESGVGMVRYLGPKNVAKLVILNRPEVVIKTGKIDALLMGSGISDPANWFTKYQMCKMIKNKIPKVLDAGALYLTGLNMAPIIITPHNGELAKLLKCESIDVEREPIKHAVSAAKKYQVTVLLKGKYTIVTDGARIIQLPAATSYLATAGTGDVLAGILGALIALNKGEVTKQNLIEIGATAAFIHAKSAENTSLGPISSSAMIHKIASSIANLSI